MIKHPFSNLIPPAIVLFSFCSFIVLGNEPVCEEGFCTTRYEVSFFDTYAPVTALDMIENIPGFTLDNGDQSTRGFSGAAGNILVDSVRLSSKSESPRDQLSAIPVQTILAIEVYRGNLGKFDLANQSVVANVIRKDDITGSGTIELQVSQFYPSEKFKPRAELNYSSSYKNIDFSTNLVWSYYERINNRYETVKDGNDQLLETRDDLFQEDGDFQAISFNARTTWREALFNLNLKYEQSDEDGGRLSQRQPVAGESFDAFFIDIDVFDRYEFGFDVERDFGSNVSAKFIAITLKDNYTEDGGLTRTFNNDVIRESAFTSIEKRGEDILRLELDYKGFQWGKIQFFVEGAVNELQSNFSLFTNQMGMLVPRAVAGAVTDVKEERIDTRLTSSFDFAGFNIEASIGAEDSTIEQTGGFETSRSFFYLKPNLTISKTLSDKRQVQARILRNVGQLNFGDFTSGVNLGDDQLQLGNPELEPEKITTFDLRYEQTFEGVGALNVTLFHDKIEDVEDQIPLRDNLEVPGNIGRGTRTGIRGEFTVPIDFTWLENARIDTRFNFQDSDVKDPVTGEQRLLSDFEQWEYRIAFRQDLKKSNLAWGLTYFADDFREYFGLDEVSAFGNEYQWSFFAEKRFADGMKLRFDIENFNRSGEARTRTVFAGRRGSSQILTNELRDTEYARRFFLVFSKTF